MSVDDPILDISRVGAEIAEMFDEIARMAEEGDAHIRLGRTTGRKDVSGASALQRIRTKARDNARFIRGVIDG